MRIPACLPSSIQLVVRRTAALLSVALLAVGPIVARAQGPHGQPLKVIVGYAPGGSVDSLARRLGQAVTEKTGRPVIVENKPGASTAIAAQALTASKPDGSTVAIFDSSTVAMNQHLFKKLAYDPSAIKPVTPLVRLQFGLAVPGGSPYRTLEDYVAAAKAKPGSMLYAHTGTGNALHLSMERFARIADIRLVAVPYRGGAPALQDVIAGVVPSTFTDMATAMPVIKSGQLRMLATASRQRLQVTPDVPTFAESGYPEFFADTWNGIFVPLGTPDEVVAQLNLLFREAAASPAISNWMQSVTLELATSTPAAFARMIAADSSVYGPLIKSTGLTLD